MKMMNMKQRAAVPLLTSLLAFVACSAPPEATRAEAETAGYGEEHDERIVELVPEAAEHARIETMPVALRSLAAELETTGRVDFDGTRIAHVSPRIQGRVHTVRALLGQRVTKGEAMAVLDSIELGRAKADFLQARARHELAEENLEREETLYADRISSGQEVLQARSAQREADAELASARGTLLLLGLGDAAIEALRYEDPQASLYPVRAPFTGKVVEKHVTVGELVTPDRNIFTVADLGQVWIWIDVYERNLGQVHLEDDVEVRVDAFPEAAFHGQVTYLSDQVDADTRTVRARIDVANPGGKLRPGMFATVRLSDPHAAGSGEAAPERPVVPEGAVQRDGEVFLAFVALEPNRFEVREVLVGRRAGGEVEILDGLAEGEHVVVEGAFLLKSEASKDSLGEGHEH